MTENDKALIVALAGVALLTPVLLAGLGWSWWYLLLAANLLAAVGAYAVRLQRRADPEAHDERPTESTPRAAIVEAPVHDTLVAVELPSGTPDYSFLLWATVVWQPEHAGRPSHADPSALARNTVLERAAVIVRETRPSDAAMAGHRLSASLGVPHPDGTGQVRAWAVDVTLGISDEDAARLRSLSDLRKRVEVWDQERAHEVSVRQYLGDDVLTSTGRALVWWMARHPDDIDGAVGTIGHLVRLSAVSQDRVDPATIGPHLVTEPLDDDDRDLIATGDLLDRLFPDSPDERLMIARDLARMAEQGGRGEYGRRLRERVGLQDVDEPPPDGDDGEPATA